MRGRVRYIFEVPWISVEWSRSCEGSKIALSHLVGPWLYNSLYYRTSSDTRKMCHNSIMGAIGWSHQLHTWGLTRRWPSNECGTKWLQWKRRLPSNRAKISRLYDQFDHVLSYCKHLKLVYRFTMRPRWVLTYTLLTFIPKCGRLKWPALSGQLLAAQ